MTASLPMYDTPSTRAANDRLWAQVRDAYGQGPEHLDRTTNPHETWENPALVLSQTCGLPYRSVLHGHVTLVGTPDYGLPDCPPGYYRSVIVVHSDDPRQQLADYNGARLARNDKRSQSGWAAVEGHLAETDAGFSFVGKTIDTGSHLASAQSVAQKDADIASLDAVTWALIKRDRPEIAERLKVIASTRPTPGLPFITAKATDPAPLCAAIRTAIDHLSPQDRALLMLKCIVDIPAKTYLAEPLPPAE